ncbi:hypothetical protein N7540_001567 [Penicillium herquei]|nr:hypothetical protein N7540_001567 [Penicillium herquei]
MTERNNNCITAFCTTVETATPNADLRDRNRFLVDVATARSCGLDKACTATWTQDQYLAKQGDITWLMNQVSSSTFDRKDNSVAAI